MAADGNHHADLMVSVVLDESYCLTNMTAVEQCMFVGWWSLFPFKQLRAFMILVPGVKQKLEYILVFLDVTEVYNKWKLKLLKLSVN